MSFNFSEKLMFTEVYVCFISFFFYLNHSRRGRLPKRKKGQCRVKKSKTTLIQDQLFPNKNHIHLSFQLHNKIIHILSNLILQPIKFQELCENSVVWKDSYYMLNNKQTEGLLFNSDDKKTKYFQKPFFLGTGLNEVRLN